MWRAVLALGRTQEALGGDLEDGTVAACRGPVSLVHGKATLVILLTPTLCSASKHVDDLITAIQVCKRLAVSSPSSSERHVPKLRCMHNLKRTSWRW